MRNHFFSSLCKFLFAAAVLTLLLLIYWSSLLVEEDLLKVKSQVEALEERMGRDSQERLFKPRDAGAAPVASVDSPRPHIDPKLPNLLIADPFYETTLPKMLGPGFTPQGFRETATVGIPDNLHVFSQYADIRTWTGYCTAGLVKRRFGFFEIYGPSAAIKIEERPVNNGDSVEYWVHLREGLDWQPLKQDWFPSTVKLAPMFLKKHPLTAHDFKLGYDAVMNPFVTSQAAVVVRQFYNDIEEVRVLDDVTFVVRWKTYPMKTADGKVEKRPKYLAKGYTMSFTPLASFVYKYYPDGKKIVENDSDPNVYRTNSTWAQSFTEHWSKNVIPSCGPYCFDGMNDQGIKFLRNPDYFDPMDALVQGMNVHFNLTTENNWQAFKQGALDSYSVLPEQLMELNAFLKSPAYQEQIKAGGSKIERLDYVYRAFTYIGWNEAKPLFKSKMVRRAMTMAIDRKRIIKQILNGMGIEVACPFYPYSPSYDNSIVPWPFDPTEARKILEEEGFADLDGDGIIEKTGPDGTLRFEFALTYYVKNPTTKAICEYVATSLKQIGVKCNLNGVDVADLSAVFDDKSFDAYFLAWAFVDPPEDPRQIWHSSGAKEKGSSNSIGFVNAEVDQLIDALTYEYDPVKRIDLYHRFDKIIHEEAPYTFMYTPKVNYVYRDYLQNVFLPVDRQDLVPGAVVAEPDPSIYWIKKHK